MKRLLFDVNVVLDVTNNGQAITGWVRGNFIPGAGRREEQGDLVATIAALLVPNELRQVIIDMAAVGDRQHANDPP